MNENPWMLYRVVLKVRPTPQHPQYWQWQFGYLWVWLYAPETQEALERAHEIAAVLPYEILGDHGKVFRDIPDQDDRFQVGENLAKATGCGLVLVACPPGADESGFAESPFP